MKLAISNIGWTSNEEAEIAELLRSKGVKYIEIAPTKKWEEPLNATDEEIEEYKQWWQGYGVEVVAFQSMLFSHPDYTMFESSEKREVTEKYLSDFIGLAGKMGACRLVFGSPKNRQKGNLDKDGADVIAKDFFANLGDSATQERVIFCVEPNAPQYNCDYITNTQEGIDIVEKVSSDGFGLHLDIACMTLAGDNVSDSIHNAKNYLKHFHISSPMLGAVEDRPDVAHREAAEALRAIDYQGYVSIEMRPGEEGENVERVRRAVEFAQNIYY